MLQKKLSRIFSPLQSLTHWCLSTRICYLLTQEETSSLDSVGYGSQKMAASAGELLRFLVFGTMLLYALSGSKEGWRGVRLSWRVAQHCPSAQTASLTVQGGSWGTLGDQVQRPGLAFYLELPPLPVIKTGARVSLCSPGMAVWVSSAFSKWWSQCADSHVVAVLERGHRDQQLQFICIWGLKEPQLSSFP